MKNLVWVAVFVGLLGAFLVLKQVERSTLPPPAPPTAPPPIEPVEAPGAPPPSGPSAFQPEPRGPGSVAPTPPPPSGPVFPPTPTLSGVSAPPVPIPKTFADVQRTIKEIVASVEKAKITDDPRAACLATSWEATVRQMSLKTNPFSDKRYQALQIDTLCSGRVSDCLGSAGGQAGPLCGEAAFLVFVRAGAEGRTDMKACEAMFWSGGMPKDRIRELCPLLAEGIKTADEEVVCGPLEQRFKLARDRCSAMVSFGRRKGACDNVPATGTPSPFGDMLYLESCKLRAGVVQAVRAGSSEPCGGKLSCLASVGDPSVCSQAALAKTRRDAIGQHCLENTVDPKQNFITAAAAAQKRLGELQTEAEVQSVSRKLMSPEDLRRSIEAIRGANDRVAALMRKTRLTDDPTSGGQ